MRALLYSTQTTKPNEGPSELHRKTGFPLIASLDLTYKCNLRCLMCNVWKIERGERDLTTKEWAGIVDRLFGVLSIRSFRLVGGEPLLHPGFCDLAHQIKKRGCLLTVVTNGTLITPKIAHFLVSENVDCMRISVDGLEKANDFYRGKGSFARAIKGAKAIVEEKKKQMTEKPQIEIHPTVSEFNSKDIVSLFSLARQFGAELRFHYLIGSIAESAPRTRDPGFPQDPLQSSVMSPQNKRAFEKKSAVFWSLGKRYFYAWYSLIKRMPIGRDCPRTAFHLIIDPYGSVFPCEHLYNISYGNCRDENVDRIWMSNKRAILRKRIKHGELTVCRICGHRTVIPPQSLLMLIAKSQLSTILKLEPVF